MLKRFFLLLLLSLPLTVSAHSPSSSYLFINEVTNKVTNEATNKAVNKNNGAKELVLRWDIALRDLETVIQLDSNLDQKISWKELKNKQKEITTYAYSNLSVQQQQNTCHLKDIGLQVVNHADGAYAVLHIQPDCTATTNAILNITYSLFSSEDANHRGVIIDQRGKSANTYIASPENSSVNLERNKPKTDNFLTFILQGIWHILIGFDHILFIVTLMLPAVLFYKNKQWSAVSEFKPALLNLLKVITAFTVAHSITLSLATLEIVFVPSRWVESAIALSVILVAVNNIKPLFSHARLSMAFLFGLVHGFGFASVLSDLNLDQGSLLFSLLGFNLGVEIGQGLILFALFPIAYILRKTNLYQTYILKMGSMFISLIASAWLVQRVIG